MLSCVQFFCDLVDWSPPGSSVYGILQAGILEWVAISYSRGSSQPRDRTYVSCLSGRFFTTGFPGKTLNLCILGGCNSTHNTLLLIEQTQSLLSSFVFCFVIISQYLALGFHRVLGWAFKHQLLHRAPPPPITWAKGSLGFSERQLAAPWMKEALSACPCAKSLQSCLTLCYPTDCSPLGSSIYGILLARILEWVALPSSRESSWFRNQSHVSYISCIGKQVLYH